MDSITSFNELLELARSGDFYTQQHLSHLLKSTDSQEYLVISEFKQLLTLAKVNDSLAVHLTQFSLIRQLITCFAELQELSAEAPETLVGLLAYPEVRACITDFNQLLQLLKKVELLRITLPPHADVRQLIQSPAQLKRLACLKINAYSEDNLAQLFINYADVRRCFSSFRQMLKFISGNPQAAQLFIKDAVMLNLIKNAKQLTNLLVELGEINSRWSRDAAIACSLIPGMEQWFNKPAELTEFLNYLPDQTSISQFMARHPRLTKLLQANQTSSLLSMDFFQNKSLHIPKPSIPISLLQYA